MPTLVVRHPDGNESEHPLSGELRIGRQEGNDLILSEGGVSRRHARLWVEGGRVMVEDMGSANGVFVDGERITLPTLLSSRSQVLLGDYELRLKVPARSGSASRRSVKAPAMEEGEGVGPPRATRAIPSLKARQEGAEGAPSALARRPRPPKKGEALAEEAEEESRPLVLKGLTGPWANQRFPVQGKLVVGRQSPPATVLLEDDSVSRRHAEVDETPEGAVLRDMGSANGTQVNGQPVGTEEVVLQEGDVIQFGMVEMVLERGGSSSLLPVRRGRGELAPRRGAALASTGGGARSPAVAADGAAPRKKLLGVAAGLVGLLLVVGILKNVAGGDGAAPPPRRAPPPPNPAEQVKEFLSQCRSYSSMEMGGEPQWDKAEESCSKALDVDPIHAEANSLMRRIRMEKLAAAEFASAEKALSRLKEEEALDLFKKIPKESVYFRRAKPRVREAMTRVVKRAQDDCKSYLRDSQWSAAVPRCERFMGFACQKMSKEELEPPLGFTLVLDNRQKLRRNEWRPKDKLYREFLLARKRVDPNAPPWACPLADILEEDEVAPDPKKEVERVFSQRFPNKHLAAAMMDYWNGRGNEALATLQKVRSNYEVAQYHSQADELLKEVSTVEQLFKLGQGHLQLDDAEKAAEPFLESLEVDKRLMGAELFEARPSFYRRNIQQDMASKAVQSGKYWDDRGDRRRSCRIWKLGFQFYAGNTDLNASVGRCSTRGLNALKAAQSCEDLDAVLDFAVRGDGLEEKARELKAKNGC